MPEDTQAAPPSGRPRGRRRNPPRPVEVRSVRRLTPRLVSVEVGGDGLDGFRIEAPTSHIKVFFPAEGQTTLKLPTPGPDGPVWPEDAPRPVMRTYTPRRFDSATNTLEIQFVLHGPGPASTWAERASVGDQLAIGGPGGRFQLDPAARRWWIGGDESAIPAVATLLETLSPDATADVHLEVDGPEDEVGLPGPVGTTVTWHHRSTPDVWGAGLSSAAQAAPLTGGTSYWVACEAAAVRSIRKDFLARGVPATALTSRGYWRLGESNHPDHDYGDDA
jgi:NADPH-dependent ferric siderophore reductase